MLLNVGKTFNLSPVSRGYSIIMWKKIISAVPQGSILGSLLFNIFLNELFLFVGNSDLSNYADDNTSYSSGNDLAKVK